MAISWKSSEGLEAQKATFGRMVQAAIRYILPAAVGGLRKRLKAGERLTIGPLRDVSWSGVLNAAGCLASPSASPGSTSPRTLVTET